MPWVSAPTKASSQPPNVSTAPKASTLFTACIAMAASSPPVRYAATPAATARQPMLPRTHGSGLPWAAENATVETATDTTSPTTGRAK